MTTDEVRFTVGWDGVELAGSLHRPPGPGPHPVVVMAQGSGPADRDSGGYFVPIRRAFLARGIATASFDKPGCGQSSGDWRLVGLDGRADQLTTVIDHLRHDATDLGIDRDRVGLFGHSQAGWLAQRLAGDPIGLAVAIASSAPSIGVVDQIHHDIEQTLRGLGHGDDDVDEARVLTVSLHRAAIDGLDLVTVEREVLGPVRDRPWFADYPAVEGPEEWQHLTLLMTEDVQPLRWLGRTTCPLLAVYGGLDRLVPPWRGAEESGRALAGAPTTDATVVVVPGGDHRLQVDGGRRFADGYLDLLADWTGRRIGRPTADHG